MEDLERFEDCILDNKESILVDPSTSRVYYFDFDEMTVRIDEQKSLKPIRYITNLKRVKVWGTRSWLRFRGIAVNKAVARLFDNYNERILLGLGNE